MSSKSHSRDTAKQFTAFRASPSETDDAIYSFLMTLDCPRSLTIWLLYSQKEFGQLVEMSARILIRIVMIR